MNRFIRLLGVAIVAALALSSMTVPATADTNATTTINGVANVGKWFVDPCDKTGLATVTGRGLYFPETREDRTNPVEQLRRKGDDTREENGVWEFKTIGTALIVHDQKGSPPHSASITVNACGWLGPVLDTGPTRFDGIGASCGASRGHDGRGQVIEAGGQVINLQDLGWTAVGGTLPVLGAYREVDESTGDKKDKDIPGGKGLVTALVQAVGGQACSGLKSVNNGNGAQTFTVVGTAELVNAPGAPQNEANCKPNGGPAAGTVDGKKNHDNKPTPHKQPCPPKGE